MMKMSLDDASDQSDDNDDDDDDDGNTTIIPTTFLQRSHNFETQSKWIRLGKKKIIQVDSIREESASIRRIQSENQDLQKNYERERNYHS